MHELNWYWTYVPYLDEPTKQAESATNAGYAKVVFKSEADKIITDKDAEIAELKEKLEDAQREVNNYRRHADECEGLAAKGDIDKVSLLEEIKDLKNDNELLDSQLYGFLQLEEECGGGDLRNYIAELKQKLEDAKATAYAESVDAGMRERKLKRALWLARAERAKWQSCYYWYAVSRKHDSRIFDEVERKCRAKAERYGEGK